MPPRATKPLSISHKFMVLTVSYTVLLVIFAYLFSEKSLQERYSFEIKERHAQYQRTLTGLHAAGSGHIDPIATLIAGIFKSFPGADQAVISRILSEPVSQLQMDLGIDFIMIESLDGVSFYEPPFMDWTPLPEIKLSEAQKLELHSGNQLTEIQCLSSTCYEVFSVPLRGSSSEVDFIMYVGRDIGQFLHAFNTIMHADLFITRDNNGKHDITIGTRFTEISKIIRQIDSFPDEPFAQSSKDYSREEYLVDNEYHVIYALNIPELPSKYRLYAIENVTQYRDQLSKQAIRDAIMLLAALLIIAFVAHIFLYRSLKRFAGGVRALPLLASLRYEDARTQINSVRGNNTFYDEIDELVNVTGELIDKIEGNELKNKELYNNLQEENAERMRSQQRNEAKTRYVADMSHELRTPLNNIMGATRLLSISNHIPAKKDALIEHMNTASNAINNLIDEILDLSKLELGSTSIELNDFSIFEMLKELVDTVRLQAETKGLVAYSEIFGNVPDVVKGDRKKILKILMNLCGNAVKYTDTGFVLVRLNSADHVESNRHDLIIEVIDSGPGIPGGLLPNIFDPYVRGCDSSKQKGIGLGTYIAKQVTDTLGGYIEVDSVLGEGTRFQVSIPLLKEPRKKSLPSFQSGVEIMVLDDGSLFDDLEKHGCLADQKLEKLRFLDLIIRFADSPDEMYDTRVMICSNTMVKLIINTLPISLFNRLFESLQGLIVIGRHPDIEWNSQSQVPYSILYLDQIDETTTSSVNNFSSWCNQRRWEQSTDSFHNFPLQKPINVLLAEDNESTRDIIETIFRHRKHNIRCVADGHQAITVVKECARPFDIIILDSQMPIMSGIDAMKVLKSLHPNYPAHTIMLTADATLEMRMDADRAGIEHFLTKPIDPMRLVIVAERLIRNETIADITSPHIQGNVAFNLKVDMNKVRDLSDNGIDVDVVLEKFVSQGLDLLRSIKDRKNQDIPGVRRVIHTIKGSASMLGAVHLVKLCSEFMTSSEENALKMVEGLFLECIEAEILEVKNTFQAQRM